MICIDLETMFLQDIKNRIVRASRFSLSTEIEILATMLLPWDDPHEVADVHGIRRGDQRNDIEVVLVTELSDDVVVSVSEGLVGRVW